jgi:hypothetical protein
MPPLRINLDAPDAEAQVVAELARVYPQLPAADRLEAARAAITEARARMGRGQ